MLMDSFAGVVSDNRISEIVISDDHSTPENYDKVVSQTKHIKKVSHFRNDHNLGMSLNKMMAISFASNEYVSIFDSDNVMEKSYLDSLYSIKEWKEDTIYLPEYALPKFDYTEYSGKIIDKNNVNKYLTDSMFQVMLNTCNYVVNKRRYIGTYVYNPLMKASDTVFFAYLWLKSGGKFHVVPNMQYHHRVHAGSGFLEDAQYNMDMAGRIRGMIKMINEHDQQKN